MGGLYTDDRLFRCHIIMARHGFVRGEYKYFMYRAFTNIAVALITFTRGPEKRGCLI